MKDRGIAWIVVAALVGLVAACATAPFTQRRQFILVSGAQEMALGADAYRETLSKARVVRDPALVGPIRQVGERIARAANQPDFQWEFNVIDDSRQANAFALPGGKVAVYTGILPVAQDTSGLAVVLGHEVGHAIAHHGAERMSQGMALQVLGTGLSVALGSQTPAARQAIMGAFGLGTQVGVLLPFGREQESEADHIGMILMAKAGYDPHAALGLWRRFEGQGREQPPEYLSTHPSYGTRQRNISDWMSEAMGYYRPDPTAVVSPLVGR